MARHDPRAALPYTPGVGEVLLPPMPSGISAENFQLPSLISQARPLAIRTVETAVPLPSAGFSVNAFLHRSMAIFIFSASFIAKVLKFVCIRLSRCRGRRRENPVENFN